MFDPGAMATKLGLDLSEYTQGMLQATSIAQVFPQTVTNFLANPLLGLASVARDVAGAVTGAIKSWVDAVAAFGTHADDIGDKAAALGVSPEFLSGWGAAFKDAGSSAEGFGESLKFLNKNASDAALGGKQTLDAFSQLGIGQDFLQKNLGNTEAMFRRVVDAIAAVPTASRQTDLAIALLGRGAGDALGAIQGGSANLDKFAETIRRLGGVVTAEDARFGDAFGKLSVYVDAAFEGIQRAAARPVLRALAEHFGDVETGLVSGSEAIQSAVERMSSLIVDKTVEAVGWWRQHNKEVADFATSVNAAARGMESLVNGFGRIASAAAPVLRVLGEINTALEPLGGLFGLANAPIGVVTRMGALDRVGTAAGGSPAAAAAGAAGGPSLVVQQMNVIADPRTTADEISRQVAPTVRDAMDRNRRELMSQNVSANILLGL